MSINDEIKKQTHKLKDMTIKGKVTYIWDYYKFWIIGAVVAVIVIVSVTKSIISNSRPIYLNAILINSNLEYDKSVALDQEFAKEVDVNLDEYQMPIDVSMSFSMEGTYTQMDMAFQTKLVGAYSTGELDVVMGPVEIMAGAANVDAYGNLDEMLPKDLIDYLKDREYEFYYMKPVKEVKEGTGLDGSDEVVYGEEYFAGIYLDNCSYLNNLGENGVYNPPEDEKDRVIFTIPANTKRLEHSIEFLKFITNY